MNKRLLAPFALLALLLTGCPHNEYTVDLRPRGDVIERTLTFFCTDGTDTNGAPNYQSFPTVELASINALYPSNGISRDGYRNIARGEFGRSLPDDIGGSGNYASLSNSLGSAGFYAERFRGGSDLAAITASVFQSADKVTGLLLGWSKMELGAQPGYEQLRRFLDVDFRSDLKNVGAYCWAGQVAANYRTNASEEYFVRIGQFLVERGYLTIDDLPVLFRSATQNDGQPLMRLIQRLVARKMGVPDSQPVPACLDFLGDDAACEKSLDEYLATTDVYQAKLKQWEESRKQDPKVAKPEPGSVIDDAMQNMMDVDLKLFGNPDDHLAVHLTLPVPPTYSNGRWDEARQQIVWDASIQGRTNLASLPIFCYAGWAEPSDSFQKEHFGEVALSGENLIEYCLWRSALEPVQGAEWDTLVANLRPGEQLTNFINNFRFSGEPAQPATNATSPSAFARELIKAGLQ